MNGEIHIWKKRREFSFGNKRKERKRDKEKKKGGERREVENIRVLSWNGT